MHSQVHSSNQHTCCRPLSWKIRARENMTFSFHLRLITRSHAIVLHHISALYLSREIGYCCLCRKEWDRQGRTDECSLICSSSRLYHIEYKGISKPKSHAWIYVPWKSLNERLKFPSISCYPDTKDVITIAVLYFSSQWPSHMVL